MNKFQSILDQNLTDDQKETFTACLTDLVNARQKLNLLKNNGALKDSLAEEADNMVKEAATIIMAAASDDSIGEQELQDTVDHYLE